MLSFMPKKAKKLPSIRWRLEDADLTIHGILLVHPESPTDKSRQEKCSFDVLMIGDTLEAVHIFFS